MKRQGVEVHFRHMEQSNKLQDIVFTMDSYHFNGSKVGRRFSYSKFGTTLFYPLEKNSRWSIGLSQAALGRSL